MLIGTNHFFSRTDAESYYSSYHFQDVKLAVQNKIKDGEIVIGEPTLKPGQKLLTNKAGGRYFIEE